MKKRLLSLLLLLAMLAGILPSGAIAASSVEEALGEVHIYNGGEEMNYLCMNGIIRNQTYTYYNYVTDDGRTKEIPAYCVNPTDRCAAVCTRGAKH